MKVEFLSKFNKDISTVKLKPIKEKLITLIDELESAGSLSEINNVKKLKGFSQAYRIRIGDYRLGLFQTKEGVELARFVHRKDIYKLFP